MACVAHLAQLALQVINLLLLLLQLALPRVHTLLGISPCRLSRFRLVLRHLELLLCIVTFARHDLGYCYTRECMHKPHGGTLQ